MIDLDELEANVSALVAMAVDAATGLHELVECAQAAASLGNDELLERVAEKLATSVQGALASSSAWTAELKYSKIDAWEQTGHQARLLAEAFGAVVPLLRAREGRAGPRLSGSGSVEAGRRGRGSGRRSPTG